jgi:hypothetical protein
MRKDLPIERISTLSELERLGVKYSPKSSCEIGVCCPIHGDTTASACINIETNLWNCHAAGCNGKGDIIHFLAHVTSMPREVVIADLGTRYDLEEVKTLSPVVIERWHSDIWNAGPLLKALYDRGITDEMIRRARLGFHDGRITIPVYDDKSRIVNVRKYLPGAPSDQKMLNTPGYSKPKLYQIGQLQHDVVWVCGGEMKALVVGHMLERVKIGAVAATAGEGSWEASWNAKFAGKSVYVCMDIDDGGIASARKIATQLSVSAKSVRVIYLPLDKAKYPRGDVNDYIGAEGAKVEDLLRCMEQAQIFTYDPTFEPVRELQIMSLREASSASSVVKTVQIDAVIQALDETPYIVPSKVDVECTRDQPNCVICPLRERTPDPVSNCVSLTVEGTSVGILSIMSAPNSAQRDAIREALKIPPCKVAKFKPIDFMDAMDVRLAPQLSLSGSNSDYLLLPAVIVANPVDLNTPYQLVGRLYPHPKTQQATLVIDTVRKAVDSLSEFKLTEEQLDDLTVFQSDDIAGKLDEIYTDIERNVTRIYQRREIHVAIDLTYHSSLYFNFDGQLQRGWLNSLIVGDSSQGKTETSLRLMEHYGLGERVDCKNATVAGLLGGLQQLGTKWMVSWGMIPTHDRRLVFLEEVKGASTEIIACLTDMRSSGVAEIPKIEKRRAHARTRQVWISNPRSDRPVSAYNFGCETIKELIGGPEDIRRFDVGLVVGSSQVDQTKINVLSSSRATVPHMFTQARCRNLTLWAWTRKPDQIRFEDGAEKECIDQAVRLCSRFTEALPLVDKGTMKYKLARLAVALAARLFSHTPDDRECLLVKKSHVAHVAKWLDDLYSVPAFGYLDLTKAQEFMEQVTDPDVVRRQILATKYPRDLVNHLLHSDEISNTDLMDWCELERDDGQKLLSLLVRKHALYRVKRWYVKSARFIDLLKSMKQSGVPETAVANAKDQF